MGGGVPAVLVALTATEEAAGEDTGDDGDADWTTAGVDGEGGSCARAGAMAEKRRRNMVGGGLEGRGKSDVCV